MTLPSVSMTGEVSDITMVFSSSDSVCRLQRAFGITPNMAPPSTRKFEMLKRDNFILLLFSGCKITNFGTFDL